MQTNTRRGNAEAQTGDGAATKLRALAKARKEHPRSALKSINWLTSKLWRQDGKIYLFKKYFDGELTENTVWKKIQFGEADSIRKQFPDIVTDPFIPQKSKQGSERKYWPYELTHTDCIKMALALHYGQEKILVEGI